MYRKLENESTLIGCLLVEPERFADVAGLVRADDFTDGLCRGVFETFQQLMSNGVPCDVVRVLNRLVERGFGAEQELRGWLS